MADVGDAIRDSGGYVGAARVKFWFELFWNEKVGVWLERADVIWNSNIKARATLGCQTSFLVVVICGQW